MKPWLIACECSGRVRDAFLLYGVDAISCDIKPTEMPGPHHQGYLEDFIGSGEEWEGIIAFPDCTYLCSSGLHWNKRRPEREEKTRQALAFVAMIFSRKCKRICVENPIGRINTTLRKNKKPQIIQPYQFGEDASKATCLHLDGLPELIPTKYIAPRIVNGKKRWANQTDSGQNRLGPSPTRAADRARTYAGIANAMAEQWALIQ